MCYFDFQYINKYSFHINQQIIEQNINLSGDSKRDVNKI